MACIAPCPTGSIDNWRTMPKARAYAIEEQLDLGRAAARAHARAARGRRRLGRGGGARSSAEPVLAVQPEAAAGEAPFNSAAFGATVPPWSAAHAYTNLFGPKSPTTATVVGNVNCTEAGFHNQTHHIVLDFGADPVPGARRPVDRHRPARRRRARPAARRAPVLGGQPAQRRAARLQQRLADGEARHRGPPGPAGARRRLQLPVRPEGRRHGAGDRPVRPELPDAEPSRSRTSS